MYCITNLNKNKINFESFSCYVLLEMLCYSFQSFFHPGVKEERESGEQGERRHLYNSITGSFGVNSFTEPNVLSFANAQATKLHHLLLATSLEILCRR